MKGYVITCICIVIALSPLLAQDSWKKIQQNGQGDDPGISCLCPTIYFKELIKTHKVLR